MSSRAFDKLLAFFYAKPKLSCALAGAIGALAMAPTYLWPLLVIAISVAVLVMAKIERPMQGAWCAFWFGMGYFTIGLYWVANALFVKIDQFWWLLPPALLGLPFLLSICWFVAGWASVKFSRPQTLARSILFLTALCAAEYVRAFNFSGFPWNLFGYTWGFSEPLMQAASLGGAYFVTALTAFWFATPALVYLTYNRVRVFKCVLLISALSFTGIYAYGALRLMHNPTQLRDDFAVLIVQPDISPEEKWKPEHALTHFMKHVDIAKNALATFKPGPDLKSVTMLWPETALDEGLVVSEAVVPRTLVELMESQPFKLGLISGLMRDDGMNARTGYPNFYNSLAALSVVGHKLNLDDIYDKHHLVPFGEFVPLEETLNLTPLVGFAGFQSGPGPKVMYPQDAPPVSSMICFEAIFPWYGQSVGAEWIANTSNDGWYGNAPGPYQHLAMTRFRAVEQGKPIARSATTGVSAMIDPYGRIVHSLDYQKAGAVFDYLPKMSQATPWYVNIGESLYFLILFTGFFAALILRNKEI